MDTNDTTVNTERAQISTLGSRIREQRQKLELSQIAFAKQAQVHRKTQINYELDERKPDSDYLQNIAKIGVNVEYVLTGKSRFEEAHACNDAYSAILEEIMIELDLYKGLQNEWEEAFNLVVADMAYRYVEKRPTPRGLPKVVELLERSPFVIKDTSDIVDLLERVEFVGETTGEKLTARRKVWAVFALLKVKRRNGSGSVDLDTVKAAIQSP